MTETTNAVPSFADLFQREATVTARAPGRVNLIGEHTDYSGGFVLPTAIPRFTVVELAPRNDHQVRAVSENAGSATPIQFRLGDESRAETPEESWADYLKGVTSVLRAEGFTIRGFDIRIASTVPLGAGLSSSASFEVAVLRALRQAFGLDLTDVRIAQLGQKTENDFVGAPVGIMDQMASSLADTGTALFLDTRSLAYERIALPQTADVIVFNSGVTHAHVGGEYAARRAECERGAAALGVQLLREAGPERLKDVEGLADPERKRCRHVITENERTQAFVQALRRSDLEKLGALLYEGHASLRDDFEVSVPEIDLIVEIARQTDGVLGARLTGGGFGGSVVILTHAGKASEAGAAIATRYQNESGKTPTWLPLRDAG